MAGPHPPSRSALASCLLAVLLLAAVACAHAQAAHPGATMPAPAAPVAATTPPGAPATSAGAAAESAGPWHFAVSGDSRDCGDLVMPKIARAVLDDAARSDFYWHLGDFRRMYDLDCDVLQRRHPGFDCDQRPTSAYAEDEMSTYLANAWQDFVDHQIRPFGTLPVFLGIGNHELYNRDRHDFALAFAPWLEQKALHAQRVADRNAHILSPGPSSYHFVHRGVDFIYLDNADETTFTSEQIVWLAKVLAQDARDAGVRTLVVGMHEALPYSRFRRHAMDATCQGLCTGQQVYDMLWRAQGLGAPGEARKHVYLLASHAHELVTDVYDTPEHQGQVLPGWIVGTAGAVQSTETIRYGYLRIAVAADGTIAPTFVEVGRDSPPSDPADAALAEFCFTRNKRRQLDDAHTGVCACGAATAQP